MSDNRWLLVFDTPSIKQYVFGTDPLREIRGASANLDRLNRIVTEREIEQALPESSRIELVYANGGAAQFIVESSDGASVRAACERVVSRFVQDTGGDVCPVYGIASWNRHDDYRLALATAHFELRSRREMARSLPAQGLLPVMVECSSASHLPASQLASIGDDEPRPLSDSSHIKEQRGRSAREHGIWAEWMTYLADAGSSLTEDDGDTLRCHNVIELGEVSKQLPGYIGLVYADGNAMGQIVQNLDSPAVCRAFSNIVDGSIRRACFEALAKVCAKEIDRARVGNGGRVVIPADILLLGGDDLLVVLPADRAIDFAELSARRFQELTEQAIVNHEQAEVRQFFAGLNVSRLTISCGVAVVRSTYPFFLLLDLAEDLLKNAKRADLAPSTENPRAARLDFHIVAGANSYSLSQARVDDYHIDSELRRTLRPLTLEQFTRLRESVLQLRAVGFPRSKLHGLHEAALLDSPAQAQRTIRDIFGRCKAKDRQNERLALWQAVQNMGPKGWSFDFPIFDQDGAGVLAIADIIEAMDLIT